MENIDISNTNIMITIAKEAYCLKQKIKDMTIKHDLIMARLRANATSDVTHFGPYRLRMTIRPGNVDYSLIPELRDVNVDAYRKASITITKLEFIGESDGYKED